MINDKVSSRRTTYLEKSQLEKSQLEKSFLEKSQLIFCISFIFFCLSSPLPHFPSLTGKGSGESLFFYSTTTVGLSKSGSDSIYRYVGLIVMLMV